MVIVVEIEDRCLVKPFLGGWRNVVTGTEYHDAFTQTCPGDKIVYSRAWMKKEQEKRVYESSLGCNIKPRRPNAITKTREKCVGTDRSSVLMMVLASSRCKYTSIAYERATQTSRLPDLRDKLVTPLAVTPTRRTRQTTNVNKANIVFTPSEIRKSDQMEINENRENHFFRLEEESAIKIQKCYRAYRARIEIGALARLSRETRAQTPPEPEKIQQLRNCRVSQFEIINIEPPKKRSDFEMLHNVLERWRYYENARIERNLFGTSKMAARGSILQREIQLLRSIESIKTRVSDERKQRKFLENLDKLAEPEVWKISNGETNILVDTLRVQRARECRDFYRSLIDENLTNSERIKILQNLKIYAAFHTCKFANDLVSLIDQEIELYEKNFETKIMNSLKKRLRLAMLRLTMNFCSPKEKLQNCIDQRVTIDHEITRTKKSFSKLCKRCGKFLSIDVISSNFDLLPTCEYCRKLQTEKEAKIVYEPYEIMLRDLRNREMDLGASSATGSLAWIVDSRIIYRLVNYVWHGKSGISECDDLFRLILVRFKIEREWSPWNTLVLTRREAALHQSMPDPWKIYASTIMKKFFVKNLQAKLRFDYLTKTNFMSDRSK